MSALPLLSADTATRLKAFHAASTPKTTTHLNLSDSGHRSLAETMLNAAGRNKEDYPHLYGALNNNGAFTGDPALDRVDLVDAGKTASGAVAVTIVSASSGDTMVKGGSLLVFDGDTGELLGHGSNSAVRSGFLHCSVDPDSAKPAGKKLSILYLGHATDGDGSTRFYSFAHEAQVAVGSGITVNVTDPQLRYNPPNRYIWIAVGRMANFNPPTNTDYRYNEPNQNETNPYLIVPFNANVALSGSINFPGLTVGNFTTVIYVNDGNGSTVATGRATQYTTDQYLVQSFKQGGAPNVMAWNFAYDSLGYAQTKSLVYSPTTGIGNQIDSYFYFQFQNIPLAGGGVAPTFYVCSDDTPGQHSLNCTKIKNIYFWWSCLAKGTQVTLEDGTQRPIEDIDVSFRVKTPQGSLAVAATVRGWHLSSASQPGKQEVYRLTTANGKTIVATATHMLFLARDKCRAISYVAAGDPILTEDGPSTIRSVEPIDYEGVFYGLALGSPEEQQGPDFPTDMAGYFAGGILHGDQLAMRHHIREAHEDLEFMLPKINRQLHRDYTSALQQKRY